MKPGPGGSGLRRVARVVREGAGTLALALLLFLFVRSFVVEAFQIATSSMESTLLVGDFLLVNKVVYGAEVPGTRWELPALERPGRGDVVVFRPPRAADQPRGTRFVKRIVGVPGDTLAMRGGVLYRNGERLHEPYVSHRHAAGDLSAGRFLWQRSYLVGEGRGEPYRPTRDDWGPLRVPADRYFVMGDNRDNSQDSRFWGFVRRESIVGRPWLVYFSRARPPRGTASFLDAVRWGRFLSTVD